MWREARSFMKEIIPFNYRLFLIMIVLCMMAEVGGIIALSVFNKTVSNGITKRRTFFQKIATLLSAILREIFINFFLSRLRIYCTWVGRRSTRNQKTSSSER